MTISVVIPTLDRVAQLRQCLAALAQQTKIPYEVIVVNNAETEESHLLLPAFAALNIRYFKEPEKGVATARNRGIRAARGEIIAFIDDDCIAEKHWVERITASFRKKNVSVLQGKEMNALPQNPFATASYVVDEAWVAFRRSRTSMRSSHALRPVYYVDTKNFSFKKNLFRKYRLRFDPHYRYCCEDMDLAALLQSRGIAIVYSPKVVVYHRRPTNFRSLLLNKFRRGQDAYRYYHKWRKNSQKIKQLYQAPLGKLYFDQFWAVHKREREKLTQTVRKAHPLRFRIGFLTALFWGKLSFKLGYRLTALGL